MKAIVNSGGADISVEKLVKLIVTDASIYLFDFSKVDDKRSNQLILAIKHSNIDPLITNFGKYNEVLALKLSNEI